jgi:hypothetical protein
MRQAAQQLVAPVVVDDRIADHRAEPRHRIGQPFRDMAAMQWQIGASGFASHQLPDRSVVRGSGREHVVFVAINIGRV